MGNLPFNLRRHRPLSAGFTLLEVMISILILLLFSVAAMQIVRSQAMAARIYTEQREATEEVESFFDLLEYHFQRLHEGGTAAYLGQATEKEGADSDTMEFRLTDGPLLGFDNGREVRVVRLQVDRVDREPVLLRESWNPEQIGDSDHRKQVLSDQINWFEVRYFDPRVNSWVENWVDRNQPPSLVRIRVRGPESDQEWVRVFQLPPMPYQQS